MLADLIGGPEELGAYAPRWEPIFWDLAERDAAALVASAGEWLAALAVVRAEGEKDAAAFQAVYAAVLERLQHLSESDPVRWHGLVRFVLSWALRRRPSAETEALLAAAQSSQADATRRQEVRKLSESIVQSRDQEMLVRGEVRASRVDLQMVLEERFGSLSEGLVQRIEAIDDLDRLRRLFRQALRSPSLDALEL